MARKVFVCPRCNDEYTDMLTARSCCNVAPLVQYVCEECGHHYSFESAAEQCEKEDDHEWYLPDG